MENKGKSASDLIISLLAIVGLFYLLSWTPRLVGFLGDFIVSSLPKIKAHLAVYLWSYLVGIGMVMATGVLIIFFIGMIVSWLSTRAQSCAVCSRPVGRGYHYLPGTGGDPSCHKCYGSGMRYDSDDYAPPGAKIPCDCSRYYLDSYICRACYSKATSYKAFGIKPEHRA